jgi:hypothetical protein
MARLYRYRSLLALSLQILVVATVLAACSQAPAAQPSV